MITVLQLPKSCNTSVPFLLGVFPFQSLLLGPLLLLLGKKLNFDVKTHSHFYACKFNGKFHFCTLSEEASLVHEQYVPCVEKKFHALKSCLLQL
jgi:hypothetical protein